LVVGMAWGEERKALATFLVVAIAAGEECQNGSGCLQGAAVTIAVRRSHRLDRMGA